MLTSLAPLAWDNVDDIFNILEALRLRIYGIIYLVLLILFIIISFVMFITILKFSQWYTSLANGDKKQNSQTYYWKLSPWIFMYTYI